MKRPTLAAVALAVAAAPATASAASIEVAAPNGSPVVTYQAAPGEVNALEMHGTVDGANDLRMPFFEFSAPLTVGPGCSGAFPVLCGAVDRGLPVAVALGDRGDVASVDSQVGTVAMNAGSGNDDVLAGGVDASADGESGNDSIRLAANNVATGDGGSGDDRVGAGSGAAEATLAGGIGNDLVVPNAFLFNAATGGSGGDRLVGFGGFTVRLSGQGGPDVVTAPTGDGSITLDGGSGSDVVVSHVGGVAANGGSGIDWIDVHGGSETAADTVSCGSGIDIAFADSGDDVSRDCELRLNRTAPTLPNVTAAERAARELLAHTPDPST
jgi:Ca2+-binding RTX toxin-like protein